MSTTYYVTPINGTDHEVSESSNGQRWCYTCDRDVTEQDNHDRDSDGTFTEDDQGNWHVVSPAKAGMNDYIDNPLRQRLDWLHSLMQELEAAGVELPMGNYTEVYSIIEEARG